MAEEIPTFSQYGFIPHGKSALNYFLPVTKPPIKG
jgi:hypothetical protein